MSTHVVYGEFTVNVENIKYNIQYIQPSLLKTYLSAGEWFHK